MSPQEQAVAVRAIHDSVIRLSELLRQLPPSYYRAQAFPRLAEASFWLDAELSQAPKAAPAETPKVEPCGGRCGVEDCTLDDDGRPSADA